MSNTPYELNHTAEAINYKLSLIDKNKNLLPYPYNTLPETLIDAGDGSLITTDIIPENQVLLNTCPLSAGKKYIVSLDVRNFKEEPISDHGVELLINGDPVDNDNIIDLSDSESSVSVSVAVQIPTSCVAGYIIRPQIEEAGDGQTSSTSWVPYMVTLCDYVDKRFNSVNTKIKILIQRLDEVTAQLSTLTEQPENTSNT